MTMSTTSRMKAGIALAGAGALALVPMTATGHDAQLAAGTTQSVNLTSASDPIQAFIDDVTTQVQSTGADRVNNPNPVGLADAPAHLAAGLAASGLRTAEGISLSPLQVVALASAIASGDQAKAVDAIKNTIDAPLWAADPALLSVWDAAPAPIGGEGSYTGAVWNAREAWRTTGNTVEGTLLDAASLPKPPKLNDVPSTSSVKTVTLSVPTPKAPVRSGNLFTPNKKSDTSGAQPGQQAKGPLSGLRDSVSKAVTKVANSVSGKTAEK